MKKILLFRFSAMGDVMLLVPVLRSLVTAHKDVEVLMVTRPRFASFFTSIERVTVFPADIDHSYNGILGLRDLFRALVRKGDFEVLIDAHDHIRTIMLRSMFKIFGTPVIVFEKGRNEKKAATQSQNKTLTVLPHTVQRYKDAFTKAGFDFPMIGPPYIFADENSRTLVANWLEERNLGAKREKWIGVAPFAMHKSKTWPIEKYSKVMEAVLKKASVKFFLFGGGEHEIKFFEKLQKQFPQHSYLVAGQLKIAHEPALLEKLDLMLCLDSSNMHLAALTGVPLLAIWGGTHPDVGFAPYGYGDDSIIQIPHDELTCRPCSVYGKDSCARGDFACLTLIEVNTVVDRIIKKIS